MKNTALLHSVGILFLVTFGRIEIVHSQTSTPQAPRSAYLISPNQQLCTNNYHIECAQASAFSAAVRDKSNSPGKEPVRFVLSALLSYHQDHGPLTDQQNAEVKE